MLGTEPPPLLRNSMRAVAPALNTHPGSWRLHLAFTSRFLRTLQLSQREIKDCRDFSEHACSARPPFSACMQSSSFLEIC